MRESVNLVPGFGFLCFFQFIFGTNQCDILALRAVSFELNLELLEMANMLCLEAFGIGVSTNEVA